MTNCDKTATSNVFLTALDRDCVLGAARHPRSALMVRRPEGPSRTTRAGDCVGTDWLDEAPVASSVLRGLYGALRMRLERGQASLQDEAEETPDPPFLSRQASGVISVTRRNSRLKLDLVWKPTSNITSVTDFWLAASSRQASPIL